MTRVPRIHAMYVPAVRGMPAREILHGAGGGIRRRDPRAVAPTMYSKIKHM